MINSQIIQILLQDAKYFRDALYILMDSFQNKIQLNQNVNE